MAPIVEYEGEQLEIDFALPQFSICPSCASQVITIADGCGICGWKKLLGDKPKSPKSGKSSLSIPCLIHRPKQPQLKGVIRKVERDSFVVYIPSDDSTVTVPKLLVYPDFPSVGQIDKSSSKSSSKTNPPSTKSSSKTRRQKGEGSGHIYYRTVTRNGKEYQQAYYQWRENGKQRTKYIPKKLLGRVEEAEHLKKPVADILELLLGGLKKCSFQKFDTFSNEEVLIRDENAKTTANCSSKIDSPPSTRKKRSSGYGGGYIEYREVKRNHKTYSQYWYHYEFWSKGDRVIKKSRYIPKRLVQKVERMNDEKVAVRKILEVLGVERLCWRGDNPAKQCSVYVSSPSNPFDKMAVY